MNMAKMSMNRYWIIAVLLGLVMALGIVVAPASAQNDEFDISIYHGINGRSLGLTKDLPVDVYVNGGLAIPGLEFKDKVETQLEAGEYTFVVKLAGTNTTVMSFGPADIPAGADVNVHAKLGAEKTPTLKVRVK